MPRRIRVRIIETGEIQAVNQAEAHRLIDSGQAELVQYADKMLTPEPRPKRSALGKARYRRK